MDPAQDNKETWTVGRLKDEVLGQIGIQLVAESRMSSFAPHTLGIVCMRTEVMYVTYH